MVVLQKYWSVLRHYRRQTVVAYILSWLPGLLELCALGTLYPVIQQVVGKSAPDATRGFIAEKLSTLSSSHEGVTIALLAFLIFGVGEAFCKFLRAAYLGKLHALVEYDMRVRMSDALTAMDLSKVADWNSGDMNKAVVMEGWQIGYGVRHLVFSLGEATTAAVFFVAGMLLNFKLALVVGFLGLIFLAIYKVGISYSSQSNSQTSHLDSDVANAVDTVVGHLKFWHSSGQMEYARKKMVATFAAYRKNVCEVHKIVGATQGASIAAGVVFIFAFLWMSLSSPEGLRAESLVFMAIFYRMVPRLQSAHDSLYAAKTYQSWIDTWNTRVARALSVPVSSQGSIQVRDFADLQFDKVSYSYPGSVRGVRDVSFVVSIGKCLGIVGESGAGKSTIVDLMVKIISPSSGQISVNGIVLRDVDRAAWLNCVGIVTADTPLFNGSLVENVALGDSNPDLGHVEKSLKIASAWEFVQKLDGGIHAKIFEGGARLSHGQRQRLALARALYRRPQVLILDEATSFLDTKTELEIVEALNRMRAQMAVVIVTHRVQAVKYADQILNIASGSVV